MSSRNNTENKVGRERTKGELVFQARKKIFFFHSHRKYLHSKLFLEPRMQEFQLVNLFKVIQCHQKQLFCDGCFPFSHPGPYAFIFHLAIYPRKVIFNYYISQVTLTFIFWLGLANWIHGGENQVKKGGFYFLTANLPGHKFSHKVAEFFSQSHQLPLEKPSTDTTASILPPDSYHFAFSLLLQVQRGSKRPYNP